MFQDAVERARNPLEVERVHQEHRVPLLAVPHEAVELFLERPGAVRGLFLVRPERAQLALPGDTSPAREVERARLVRQAIGPGIDLMCDINQRWSVHQAIDIGGRLEDVHFFWWEDVTAHDDYAGIARVADALATPVAGGEYVYGIAPFRHMLEARSVDVVMIDLLRVGGIANWMKVAGMAQAFNLPVVSHLFPEIHVHLVAAAPNGLTVEYMPWSLRLFEEAPRPVNGQLEVPSAAGLGLRFNREVIERYALR